MSISIIHRYTGAVLYVSETADSVVAAVIEAAGKGAYLRGANLRGAYLEGAYLRGAYLEGAYLEGANLRGANLEGAYLEGAYLEGAYLEGANLEGANLEGAYLGGANLGGAYLRGANLRGANLDRWSLVIVASRHVITAYRDRVRIGCHERDIDSWLKIYVEVGKREGYSEAEIEEYGGHLKRIKAAVPCLEVPA